MSKLIKSLVKTATVFAWMACVFAMLSGYGALSVYVFDNYGFWRHLPILIGPILVLIWLGIWVEAT